MMFFGLPSSNVIFPVKSVAFPCAATRSPQIRPTSPASSFGPSTPSSAENTLSDLLRQTHSLELKNFLSKVFPPPHTLSIRSICVIMRDRSHRFVILGSLLILGVKASTLFAASVTGNVDWPAYLGDK